MGTVKGDLPLRDLPTDIRPVATGSNVLSFASRAGLAGRSLVFFVVCFSYFLLILEPLNWLVVAPLTKLLPSRRDDLVGGWLKFNVRLVLALARILAGVRIRVQGVLPPESLVLVMNHQSILDILVGIDLIRGTYPLIPTRASYGFGIPGISSSIKLMRCPLVTQKPVTSRSELRGLLDAARRVALGKNALLIYPEGHRSRNGAILPFMKPGLRLFLSRAPKPPVYVAVIDGLGDRRGFLDSALRLAGSDVRVAIAGPYNTPARDVELDGFIDSLRDRMVETLDRLRRDNPETSSHAQDLASAH